MRDTALPPPVSLRRRAPGLERAYTLLDWAQSCPAPPCGPPRPAPLWFSRGALHPALFRPPLSLRVSFFIFFVGMTCIPGAFVI